MKKILLAGATGYLGGHLLQQLESEPIRYDVKYLVRNPEKLKKMGVSDAKIIVAEVTKSETLAGQLKGTDTIISTVGITRQKDGLTYMDVDYQANENLLQEAMKAGVSHFVYVSVLNGEQLTHLKICAAKEQFVNRLKASGMDYTIIRPNGFFSDMGELLEMAKRGKIYLFGDGTFKANPIHGVDLVQFILKNLDQKHQELPIGGPDILSHNDMAKMAFEAVGKHPKITYIPVWLGKAFVKILKACTSEKTYGPVEFFTTTLTRDLVTHTTGNLHLSDYYYKLANKK